VPRPAPMRGWQFNQLCYGRLLPMTDDERVVDAVALECINLFSRPTANPTLRRGRADMRIQAAENGLSCGLPEESWRGRVTMAAQQRR
jgi:hypothetical protein